MQASTVTAVPTQEAIPEEGKHTQKKTSCYYVLDLLCVNKVNGQEVDGWLNCRFKYFLKK